jgi:hypothetical protein
LRILIFFENFDFFLKILIFFENFDDDCDDDYVDVDIDDDDGNSLY